MKIAHDLSPSRDLQYPPIAAGKVVYFTQLCRASLNISKQVPDFSPPGKENQPQPGNSSL